MEIMDKDFYNELKITVNAFDTYLHFHGEEQGYKVNPLRIEHFVDEIYDLWYPRESWE